jgi:hypothetical protein
MPAVPITSSKMYEKAIEVLTEAGGTWQGVGSEEQYLLVSPRQFEALVAAKVTRPEDANKKAPKRGKTSRKATKS